MVARRGIVERLIGRVRGWPPPPVDIAEPPTSHTTAEQLVDAHVAEASAAMRAGRFQAWLARPEPFPRGMEIGADPALQIACLRVAMDRLAAVCRRSTGSLGTGFTRVDNRGKRGYSADETDAHLLWLVVSSLVYRRLPYAPEDAAYLLDRSTAIVSAFPIRRSPPLRRLELLLLRELLAGISRWAGAHTVGPEVRAAARRLRDAVTASAAGDKLPREERSQLHALLVDLVDGGGPGGVLNDRDAWGGLMREALARLDPAERAVWRAVFEQAATANAARPTEAWLKTAGERVAAVGEEAFARAVVNWLGYYVAPPCRVDAGADAAPPESSGTAERNVTVLRGLIWCCAGRDNARIARAVGDATEASFKKVPGIGPRSLKLGNAGIHALGAMPGMHGIEELVRLRQRVVYAQARTAIDGALDAAAARLGLAREDLDDLATPTFQLVDGRRRFEFAPFAAELSIDGAAGVAIRWLGPDGAGRRTEPVEVKRRYPEERAALKRTADDLRKTLLAQRDRLERLLFTERSWPLPVWRERYLDHPLLADPARRLVWMFEHDRQEEAGAWRDGAIVDAGDRPLVPLPPETLVRLWHPVRADGTTTAAWQAWLERHGVRQPFKQAHREIYVLTDAERATATYSNRFAAHILRQHQFRALAQGRGWRYRLQGGFDDRNAPSLELPGWRLTVEFLVEPIEADATLTNGGVYPFVVTDQVRFRRLDRRRRDYYDRYGDVVPLAEIPPLVFTEVMRDVDLFVGVASVGADPTWRDRGPQRIREYWEGYAFGELTASAQTRRVVLERLVPRLAIAPRCELEERFLVVRGDLRTYRIHLGSGNILMEPNSQYLCIVPKPGGNDATAELFLPFEGDTLLATILSKAILLANDRAITDPTIARQIGRTAQ